MMREMKIKVLLSHMLAELPKELRTALTAAEGVAHNTPQTEWSFPLRLLRLQQEQEDAYVSIAEEHITRYESMLRSNAPHVRVNECREYLAIWNSIKTKKGSYYAFTDAEREELAEACYSGEYDDKLQAKEEDTPA